MCLPNILQKEKLKWLVRKRKKILAHVELAGEDRETRNRMYAKRKVSETDRVVSAAFEKT